MTFGSPAADSSTFQLHTAAQIPYSSPHRATAIATSRSTAEMRGKRSKQYRKLMSQYQTSFNFRPPYQVLVDSAIILSAHAFHMSLIPALTRTLYGHAPSDPSRLSTRSANANTSHPGYPSQAQKHASTYQPKAAIKPMITQCSMRALYALNTEEYPRKAELVAFAKEQFERRRCGHHVLDEPLPEDECLRSVIDAKGGGSNRNRYVLASQDEKLRGWGRTKVRGLPLVYIKRSVMIMEPMSDASRIAVGRVEKEKLREGIRRGGVKQEGLKRKRVQDGGEATDNDSDDEKLDRVERRAEAGGGFLDDEREPATETVKRKTNKKQYGFKKMRVK